MIVNTPEPPAAVTNLALVPQTVDFAAEQKSVGGPPPARQKIVLLTSLVVLAVIGGSVTCYERYASAAASSAAAARGQNFPVPVVEGIAATKNVPIYLDGLGTVQAFNSVAVHSRVDGQLMTVAFTEGQEVAVGDVLAQLDPAPYRAALDAAAAKKAQDEAQFANARLDLQRYSDLLKTESTTQQTFDTQKALVDQLAATIHADEATVETARVNLAYTTIHSPIEGRVGIRQVDQGNLIHANDANGIVMLTQLHPISVVFTLPEQALSQLHPQSESAFSVLALARDNTNVLATGKLAVIDNQIDTTTGTIKLKATFANENLRLWPGQFVNTRLLLTTFSNGVVVPASVVQRGPEGAYAFVIAADETVAMRAVQVAQIEAGEALIDSGLTAGERVVVDGQYKLQVGSHVKTAGTPDQGGGGGRAIASTNKYSGKKP